MTTTTVGHDADEARLVARRAERFRARHLVWDSAPPDCVKDHAPALRKCGRVKRVDGPVTIRVSVSPSGARTPGWSGLASCGSVWACPVCSAKIAARRQTEIEAAIVAWVALGGRVALLTQTMRHNRGQRLKTLWDAYSAAWTASTSGAAWKADQAAYGSPFAREVKSGKRAGQIVMDLRIPTIRVVEVTNGAAGWHVHVHALLFLPAHITTETLGAVADGMFGRWSRSLVSNGLDAPTLRHGTDVKLLDSDEESGLSEYFTKTVYGERKTDGKAASYEAARGDLKDAKNGNRTPFGILRSLLLAKSGEVDPSGLDLEHDTALWREWEEQSKGRRQIAWSPGLRAMLIPDVEELTDEEIAEESPGGDDVAEVDAGTVRQIMRHRADWQVLSAFGRSNREGWELLSVYVNLAEDAERALSVDRARWRQRS